MAVLACGGTVRLVRARNGSSGASWSVMVSKVGVGYVLAVLVGHGMLGPVTDWQGLAGCGSIGTIRQGVSRRVTVICGMAGR